MFSKSLLATEFEWEWSALGRIEKCMYLSPCLLGCVYFSPRVCFLCRCAFQGRALWWKAAHGWIIVLPSFCLTDSCLYSADGSAAFPSAPHTATCSAPTLPFPVQNLSREAFNPTFLFRFLCVLVVFVSCCFSFPELWFISRQDDRINPPVPINKIFHCRYHSF